MLGGGVACNRALAAAMRERVAPLGASVFAPTPRLATDNAAMIARAGLFHFERGERDSLDLNAYASHADSRDGRGVVAPVSYQRPLPATRSRLASDPMPDATIVHPFAFDIGR